MYSDIELGIRKRVTAPFLRRMFPVRSSCPLSIAVPASLSSVVSAGFIMGGALMTWWGPDPVRPVFLAGSVMLFGAALVFAVALVRMTRQVVRCPNTVLQASAELRFRVGAVACSGAALAAAGLGPLYALKCLSCLLVLALAVVASAEPTRHPRSKGEKALLAKWTLSRPAFLDRLARRPRRPQNR